MRRGEGAVFCFGEDTPKTPDSPSFSEGPLFIDPGRPRPQDHLSPGRRVVGEAQAAGDEAGEKRSASLP